jgi:hypothetical protein
MGLEEPRVLPDDIHYVRCHDRLVVFAALNLAKTKQVLDDRHEKTLLRFLVCYAYISEDPKSV